MTQEPNHAAITFENVSYAYMQKHLALDDVSLKIDTGSIFSIIGSNGCGKSTLLHLAAGLIFAEKGNIWYKHNEISVKALKSPTFNAQFRSNIGYVFQNPDAQLFCPTVFDELLFGPLQLGMNQHDAIERANSLVDMLCISDIVQRPTYALSGGQKKRVAIGAALSMNPEILLFDEPMSGLDPKTRSFVIDLLLKLNKAGKTIIIATHHLELVDHLQSKVAVLSESHKIVKTGQAREILTDIELLVNTNLISEHWHKHDDQIHRHLSTGYLYHKH